MGPTVDFVFFALYDIHSGNVQNAYLHAMLKGGNLC